MSQNTSDRRSNESINFEIHTHKKQKQKEDSYDICNTGHGMIPST
jgi:hypothetical protein